MNRRYRTTLLSSLLLLGGCDMDELGDELELDEPEAPASLDGGLELEVAPQAEPETEPVGGQLIPGVDPQCMQRRAPVMNVLEDSLGDCALELGAEHELWDSWQPLRLFEEGSPLLEQMNHHTVPDQLMRYCKYEYIGDGVKLESDYAALASAIAVYPSSEPDTLSTDCVGVGPMSGLAEGQLVSEFNAAFRRSVGAVRDEQLQALSLETVRVGMLDTATEGVVPRHAHADQMRAIVTDLMGGRDDSIHQSLVTPRYGVDAVDWEQGGDIGYPSDFVAGMYAEILAWVDQLDEGEWTRLVLAEPVGYDIEATYATDPNRATTRAMLDVHKLAACYGAIVIAPAGNIRPGSCDTGQDGMLAPAAFETLARPNEAECAGMGFEPTMAMLEEPIFAQNGDNLGRLVYAVGGLDKTDRAIDNARPDSMPRMAAYAMFGTGDATGLLEFGNISPMTGTSISTAAVAAAAALRWAVDPAMLADEVMEEVYASGWSTALVAGDGQYVGQPVKRLSLCRVLANAGYLQGSCPATPPVAADVLDPIINVTEAIVATTSPGDIVEAEMVNLGGLMCSPVNLVDELVPQPDKPVCAMCSSSLYAGPSGEHVLFMNITPEEWAIGLEVTEAYLHVSESPIASTTYSLDDHLDAINTADPEKIIISTYSYPAFPVSATIEFKYDDGTTYWSAIPISNNG